MAILTGQKIREEVMSGCITIDPYAEELVGTNSVDLHLYRDIKVYDRGLQLHKVREKWANRVGGHEPSPDDEMVEGPLPPIMDMLSDNKTNDLIIPDHGLVFWPGVLYLGRTVERIGSNKYVPWFDGRSSLGRLGIHVHVTAGRGDTGWFGTVTLEMHVVHPIRVYAGKKPVCQVSFFDTVGDLEVYSGRYQDQIDPTASRLHMDQYDRTR